MSKNCIITTVKGKIKGNATSYIERESEIIIPISKKFTLKQTRAMAQDKVNKINKEYLSEKFGEVVSLNSSYTDGTGINIHPSQRLVDAYEVKEGNKTIQEVNSNRDLKYFNGDQDLLTQDEDDRELKVQKELDKIVEDTNNLEDGTKPDISQVNKDSSLNQTIKPGVEELFASKKSFADYSDFGKTLSEQEIINLKEEGNKVTAKQFLESITPVNDFEKKLKSFLLSIDLNKLNNFDFVVNNKYQGNIIGLNERELFEKPTVIFNSKATNQPSRYKLHEFLHSLLDTVINQEQEFRTELISLYDYVKTLPEFKNEYGVIGWWEFYTEGMTNPYFQAKLKNVTLSGYKGGKKSSVYKEFIKIINSLLEKLGFVNKDYSALDEIINATTKVIEKRYGYGIKPGVQELFESNSELANAIYETLGFKSTTSIPNYEVVTRPTKDIGKSKGRTGNFVEITTPDNYRTNMSAYMVQTNDDGKLFITNIEKYNEDSTFKGFGTVAYVDFFENYKNQGITTDKKLTADGIKLLERLEKIGLVYKTNAKLIDDTQVSKIYNTKIYEYDKPLYEFNFNWSRSQITLQQKQQAQIKYSQYLEQNPNGNVEQFKSWVDSKNNQLNSDSLFGLNTQNQEQLEFHMNTLNVVSQFLENIGVEPRLVTNFLSQDGNVVEGAIAAANFIDGTVDIIDDLEKGRTEAWNKLPEEAAHWWYRLLDTNSPLKKALWESHQTALKNDELYAGQYGKLVKSPSDLTEESIGQLIAEAIKRIETKNGSVADYSFFKKFLEWINSIIDIFKNTKQDPFEVAAMKILSSDMSDLMTWEEYRKVNNIVNFADVLTEQSVAPIDYTLIEDIGVPDRKATADRPNDIYTTYTSTYLLRESLTSDKIVSPEFNTKEELDNWVNKTYGNLLIQRQKDKIQEIRDNQQFFDRLLNKSFKKKSKFLPKTLRKYFEIIDSQNLNPLGEWNISQELQQITKKLSEQEKKQIVETNGYTNIAPTLKVLPELLKKYKKNPIVLSEPIKIDGAKKQELSILNGIKDMIKLENPNLKSITAEEFVAEAHNWLETNYLLGFANEKSYLSYHVDQTFTYVKDRFSNENSPLATMTEEEINRLPFEERQRIANVVGLTKENPDVYHNKVSLRFNDMYHLKSGHFDKSPSAWGNLTYFYTGKNKWKDAVLLHEIQNDNIEFLREFKADKVDLETSLGRYLQQLNTDLLDNIAQIDSGGKRIQKNYYTERPRQFTQLNYQLQQLVNQPLEQGLQQLKQNLNEKIELYKSDDSIRTNSERVQEEIEKIYSQKRKFADLQKKGGIKSLLTKEELENLKELLKELNTGTIMTNPEYLPDENQFEPGYETIRDLASKKADFQKLSSTLVKKINFKVQELYGKDFPNIILQSPIKPRTKAQKRAGAPINQSLNENVNFLLAFSELQLNKNLSKLIEEYKKIYIQARNATNAYNFNVNLVKITQEQYNNLIENYRYNQDLLNRLIDEQAQKDLKSPELEKIAKAKSIIQYLGDDSSVKLGKGKYGFIWDTANTDKGIVSVWDAYKAGNTNEDSYVDNWSVDEFLKYVKQIAPEYLTLDTKSIDVKNQEFKFDNLKEQALNKKAELEKNYGKIEDEVKQTLEVEMNYFTPLVHHLIQKHIKQYGKDFPMYFSGYNITKLTQGNDRTALIYAGKDEINIVDRNVFKFNEEEYTTNEEFKDVEGFDNSKNQYFKNDIEITQQEYDKAYQQATERRAKEIKYIAAIELGLLENNAKLSDTTSDKELEEGIKKLNEFKKIPKSDPKSKYNYKSNLDVVIELIMRLSNNKPIETGAIYNAMSQVSGIKLVWQDKIDGLQGNTGGYLVDLSNYNYNVPILYGLQNNKPQENNSFQQFQQSLNKPNTNPILQGNQTNIEEIITHLEKDKLLEIDCKGKLKANLGLTTNQNPKFGDWEIIKDLQGKPSHKQGGFDLNIKGNTIEAEGNELVLKNSVGDLAIIPKKDRFKIKDLISTNDEKGLNDYISKLPKEPNKAGDGGIYSDKYVKNNFFNRIFRRNDILEKQIMDENKSLYNIGKLKDFKVLEATGKSKEHLEKTNRNPEYFPKGDSWFPYLDDVSQPIKLPNKNKYRTLVNDDNLSDNQLRDAVKFDFISHSLHQDKRYNELSSKLSKKLLTKYDQKFIDNNGGTDAYVRGLLSDSEEYKPYKNEMSFIEPEFINEFKIYVKTGK